MNNNYQKNPELSPKNKKEEKILKQPLFKMFMNNSNRKLHLIKNNISNSKDSSKGLINNGIKKIKQKNYKLNLQLFSYKVLEAKHNSTPELYLKKILNILIKKKKSHLLADFNEKFITFNYMRDYLKRYYTYPEVKERIPKYVSYYKNYLTFFCRPVFVSYIINKKMIMHMEKVAQIFYNENYADDDKQENKKSKKKKEKEIRIFSKKIMQEIEDGDTFTVVTSEAAMIQIQKMNTKINNNKSNKNSKDNEDMKKRDNDEIKYKINLENNVSPIQIEQITIFDNNYKITPINVQDKKIEINTSEIISELKNKDIIPPTNNSINLLMEQLQTKEKKEEAEDNKEIQNIDNVNNISKNCIVIQGGKTTNNINININHLTIGQKALSPKESPTNKLSNGLGILNNNHNPKNKILIKFKDINWNTKDKNPVSNQKLTSDIKNDNNTNKEKHKNKNKNFTLTLPPPSHNTLSRTNSVVIKKFNQIFPKSINNNNNDMKHVKDIKEADLFKKGYDSPLTCLHKYISFGKIKSSKYQLGKAVLNTNNSNRLKNIFKDISSGTSKASKNINIIYTKKVGILSGERTRSISNMKNKSKRIIYSSLHFNGTSMQLLNFKNSIGAAKNNEKRSSSTGKRFIEFKTLNNKIPLIKNKEEESKTSKAGLKIKGKQLDLQKLLNIFPKKSSKTKRINNLNNL